MNEDLPSINDFIEDSSNLPSVSDFIEETPTKLSESVEFELPSYKEFLEEEPTPQVKEQPSVVSADLSSVITLIEGVRNSIPEVKSYDKELYELMHLIEELRKDIPVVKSYDQEIREIKESIPSYDKEIKELRESIPTIPEVKYYDQDIKELKESISEVKDRYIPDFRWIYKSFNQLDEGQENLTTSLSEMKNRLEMEMNNFLESIEVVKFETGVDTKSISERVDGVDERLTLTKETITENIGEIKDKIYKELRDTSLRVWSLKKEFQEDDKKLNKEITEQYKKLRDSILSVVDSNQTQYTEFDNYLNSLKKQISNLPEVKYYDEQIKDVNESVKSVKNLVEVLENKLNKKIAGLRESILVVPPSENNTDPLTPLDQNFATLDDLSNHYRSFLNRIQQQLATLGGGGEVRLEFLDDVDRDSAKIDGRVLAYQASTGKFIGTTNSGGGSSFSGTSGQLLQHNGSDYVGVSSVGIATFVNDYHQGYYRYTTNYYTTGVANTVQNLPADEFVLIQPSVRSNKIDFMPQVMLDANNNDPWVGSAATIGTGHTQFSLAGLDAGSSVIVRIAAQIDPDVDNTNVDFALNFTTNPTTQGYGVTNFSITKEQAIICNEGADQNYISETLFNFYVGSSLSGLTTTTAGSFNVSVRVSDESDFEMMAFTVNVVA